MSFWSRRLFVTASAALIAIAVGARAADIDPHRALYTLSLQSSRAGSGVIGASGAMYYAWGETCDGWTVEQRFRLRLSYAEEDGSELASTLVTWEAKDGLSYRFDERRTRDGALDEELRGEAHLDGPGKGGTATFTRPENTTVKLAPGVLFPTAHTLLLLDRAAAGDKFIARPVFDGSSIASATEITAVIGPRVMPAPLPPPEPGGDIDDPAHSKLLQHPSWRVRLAFFSPDAATETPDYELGMRLLANGVSADMTLDYGDYVVSAELSKIEALSKPAC